MIGKHIIIFICLAFNSLMVFAQNTQTTNLTNSENKYILLKHDMLLQNKLLAPTKVYFEHKKLPFFCDLELKLEASAGIPVKFRLGEVQAVEKQEGKH